MFLGVDYYPEHWDINLIDSDIARIKKLGCNVVRIGEFAWHLMEPEEGCFDFSFFDMVIDKLKKNNIKIIFGTPTATFPAWLYKKHPNILSKDENLQIRSFGGRRQYCFNSPEYNRYSLKITEELVKHYSREDAIIAWQIDNELGHEGSDLCYCENCHKEFINFLEVKYQSIKELNEVYGTVFWGQTYNSFSEVPIPTKTITIHNPSLMLDLARFRSFSLVSFANRQICKVRAFKGKNQLVTTNLPGGLFDKYFEHWKLAENLDFVSYDNYPVWGGLEKPVASEETALSLDFIRGLKNKNFWIVEQLMGAQGHDIIGYLPRPNEAQMWAYQAFAHGCSNMLWFRWRAMDKGAEQFCLGIIDQNNREGRKFKEVAECIDNIKKHDKVINSEINSDVALIYDYDNVHSWKFQQQSAGFNFLNEALRLYRPFYRLNVNIDVIPSVYDISKYKVVILPAMQIIDDDLFQKLDKFAVKGGTVIFGFRSGIKNKNNNLYFDQAAPCKIGKMAGIEILESESLGQTNKTVITDGKNRFDVKVWCDYIDSINAEVLYSYDDKFYRDKACITKNRYKNCDCYYIGGGVDDKVLLSIAKDILNNEKIRYMESPEGIELYSRKNLKEQKTFIINHTANEIKTDDYSLKPYQVKIIKE